MIVISSAYNFNVSRVFNKGSFSKMFPVWSEILVSKSSSRALNFSKNSPYNLSSSILFSSMSGLSFLRYKLMHWFSNDDWVTVKLTKVTLEHKSGVNFASWFRVNMNILNYLLKSISWSPTLTITLPLNFIVSLFKIELSIGSTFSTFWIKIGSPNLNDFSSTFKKLGSWKSVFSIFLSL